MSLFNWNATYSVNVRKLDEQHKVLLEIINGLYESMSQGRAGEVLESTVKDLIDYTKVHFREEEAMMRAANVPMIAIHQAQHKTFEDTVERLQQDVKCKNKTNYVNLLHFLKDWLVNHIKQTDKQYTTCMNSKGYV